MNACLYAGRVENFFEGKVGGWVLINFLSFKVGAYSGTCEKLAEGRGRGWKMGEGHNCFSP